MQTALSRTSAPARVAATTCAVYGAWSRDSFPRMPNGDLVVSGIARVGLPQRA